MTKQKTGFELQLVIQARYVNHKTTRMNGLPDTHDNTSTTLTNSLVAVVPRRSVAPTTASAVTRKTAASFDLHFPALSA